MSRTTINELVAVCAGTFGLALYAGLILVPAWTPTRACGSGWPRRSCRCTCSRCSWASAWPGRSRRRLLLGLAARCPTRGADAITEAVESGAGLPEVVRAAAKALDASLAVTDAWGATLAVAARSPAEERALLARGEGVTSIPLRVADTVVGALHMRAKTRAERARCGGCWRR